MAAYQQGKLRVRHNLHLGVGLLAATSASNEPGRLRFDCGRARGSATSPTWRPASARRCSPSTALAARRPRSSPRSPHSRTPTGSSRSTCLVSGSRPSRSPRPTTPLGWRGPWSRAMDGLEIERAHLVGNSMGGRVALEAGHAPPRPGRAAGAALPCGRVAARPPWAGGAAAAAPRARACSRWPRGPSSSASCAACVPGADRRLGRRRRGRVPALLPHPPRQGRVLRRRTQHLPRRAGRREGLLGPALRLSSATACSCGARTTASCPWAFAATWSSGCRAAEHLVLQCGHVPQVEVPAQTHHAMLKFLG